MSSAARLAADAWAQWMAEPRPLDRIFSGLVRGGRVPPPVSAAGWARVTAAARFAGFLAARRDLRRWLATDDVRGEISRVPDFWRGVEALMAEPEPSDRAAWRRGDLAHQVAAAGVAPAWASPLAARFGSSLASFLLALDRSPPLWIRARRTEERDALEASLRGDGFRVRRGEGLSLQVVGERAIHGSRAARDGMLEVQDLASQRVVDLLPATGPVWDACAGEGGKTMALASRLGGRSSVWASDVSAGKLETLRKRVVRAGWQNVRVFPWGGDAPPERPREAAHGFRLVLVDAPCSASGTWRRNPEVRLSRPAGESLLALQARILENAAAATHPEGALAWVTCSVDHRENEAQIAQLGGTVETAGLEGSPDLDSDTLFLAVIRSPRRLSQT